MPDAIDVCLKETGRTLLSPIEILVDIDTAVVDDFRYTQRLQR